jgi:two-component system sensor kinase FixL
VATLGSIHRNAALSALLVSLGYYLGAKIGFALTLNPHPVSTLWPTNAILLGALLLTPIRSWWVMLLAIFPAHLAVQLQSGVPIPMMLCWFVSNCSEALIGAIGVRRFIKGPPRLDSFARVGVFVAFAGFLAPFLSSFLDAGFVVLNGWGEARYWQVWRTRCLSNILANLTIVPVIVVAGTTQAATLRKIPRRRAVEAAIFVTTLITICVAVFVVHDRGPSVSPALVYLPLPLLLWAAVRFGPGGTSGSVLVFALLAIWGASQGHGPFIASAPAENALTIQLFLISISIPLMALAAVLEERGRAVDTVRQSEEHLNLALNAAQLGTWDWDLRTNSAKWSSETKTMFGVPDETEPITLDAFAQILHPADRSGVLGAISHAVERATPLEVEYRIVQPDGSLRWVMSKGKILWDESGASARMIGVNVDMTDRKRAEIEAQEHRREVAHLGRVALVGELSGALAHELNQPLAAILANARAGQRYLAHDPPNLEQVHEILDAIVHDDRRAGDVINRLRALLKKDEASIERLKVNVLAREVIEIAHGDLIAREISISTNLAVELPPITGDRVQLQQVLLNLVLNASDAMEATPPGLRRLTLTTARAGHDAIRISVSDTGVGIPPDNIESIFDPFVTSKFKGLGLGLAICRSIVSAHEGHLQAENNVDSGATFHVTLPSEPVTAPMSAQRSSRGQRSVGRG